MAQQAAYGQQAAYQIYAYGNAIGNGGYQMAQQQNYAALTKMEAEKSEHTKRIGGTDGVDELPNEICQIPIPY